MPLRCRSKNCRRLDPVAATLSGQWASIFSADISLSASDSEFVAVRILKLKKLSPGQVHRFAGFYTSRLKLRIGPVEIVALENDGRFHPLPILHDCARVKDESRLATFGRYLEPVEAVSHFFFPRYFEPYFLCPEFLRGRLIRHIHCRRSNLCNHGSSFLAAFCGTLSRPRGGGL